MMSVAPVASAGEAAGYYSNSDNYYFLGSLQSLWMGEGAPGAFLNRRWRCRCMTTTAGVRAWPWFPWLPARKGG